MSEAAIQQIQDLLHAGRNDDALSTAEQLTCQYPGNAKGWLLRGSALLALGRPVMAVEHLRRSHELAPDSKTVADSLRNSLVLAGLRLESIAQHDAAESMYREAVTVSPDEIPPRLNLGRLLCSTGSYDDARLHLRAVLALQPEQPDACAALALSYEYEGDYQTAVDILKTSLDSRPVAPSVALAYAALAKHLGDQPAAAELLEEVASGPAAEEHRIDIHFALGKLYDSMGDYDRAFEHYRLGNRFLDYSYDPEDTRKTFSRISAVFSADRLRQLPRASNETSLPVFIVGMPRSGTTLVEQILASHPDVHGAGELNDIARIVHALGGVAPDAEVVERMTVSDLDRAAQDYFDMLLRIAPGVQRVTDKMPHNFLALGYIDILFPGCRIIHCVRNPRDTCLSIWFQHMTGNHPYTSDLNALADYYRQYQMLMAHWKSVIRVPVLEARYEDTVGDTELVARDLVEFCGLSWDDRCLRFHENARLVSTPTYDGVRRPVHDKSVGRWRHYERHLGALAGLESQQV